MHITDTSGAPPACGRDAKSPQHRWRIGLKELTLPPAETPASVPAMSGAGRGDADG